MADKISTKQRILETALRLFNEQGFGHVTTAMLAKEAGIAEGNLWYHFRDKTALLTALSDGFQESVEKRLEQKPTGGPVLPEYLQHFRRMAEELMSHLFLFRDQADYGARIEAFNSRVPDLYRRSAAQYRSYFEMMREQDLLDITDAELQNVITALLMLFRYYPEFVETADLPEKTGMAALQRVFALHLRLFEDRLSKDALLYFQEEMRLKELPEKIM